MLVVDVMVALLNGYRTGAVQVMVGGAVAHPAATTEPDVTVARNRTDWGNCPSTRQRPRRGAQRHPQAHHLPNGFTRFFASG